MNPSQTYAELDKVFLIRQKKGSYHVLTNENKLILKEEFDKNPFPQIKELKLISKKTQIPMNKVKNWFVYQRRVDFQKSQKYVKSIKKKYSFNKEAKMVLENAFRKSSHLEEDTLIKLKNVIGCPSYQIKRWFYYRNQKLRNILHKKKSIKETIPNVVLVKINEKIENEEPKIKTQYLPTNCSIPQIPMNVCPSFLNMQLNQINASFQNLAMRNHQLLQNPSIFYNYMNNPLRNYLQNMMQPKIVTPFPAFNNNCQFLWR